MTGEPLVSHAWEGAAALGALAGLLALLVCAMFERAGAQQRGRDQIDSRISAGLGVLRDAINASRYGCVVIDCPPWIIDSLVSKCEHHACPTCRAWHDRNDPNRVPWDVQ